MLTQITTNIRVEQAKKLNEYKNKSEVIRKALDKYFKEEK